MTVRRLVLLFCLLAGTASALGGAARAASDTGRDVVVVVPIDGVVDQGMAHLVARAVGEAKTAKAKAIVLDINTPGGLVSAGMEIRDSLKSSSVPVDAFVRRGISAGALITLSAAHIVVAQDGWFGDAQPIPNTVKNVAAVRTEFESAARNFHRNERLAAAMVDARIDAPPYKKPGQPLTLRADQAKATGFSEATVRSLDDAMAHFGVAGATRIDAQYTVAEQIARIATNPEISGILLAIGFLGLLIELQTLHGIAGAIGAFSLALFFGTHVYAGFSNGLVVALAVVGILLLLLELHVLPGHGIAGAVGGLTLLAAVFLAFGVPFFVAALQAIAIAIVLSVFTFWLLQRVLPENAFMKRLMFAGAQGPDYVASADHRNLLGKTGTAMSYLRPAGVAAIGDQRVDVLTEGDFVPAGTPVRVTRVEGARIFVRPVVSPGG